MSDKRVANSLVALSSAAVVAVYGTGYVRTRAAAERFSVHAAERKPRPALASSGSPTLSQPAAPIAVPAAEGPPPSAPGAATTDAPATIAAPEGDRPQAVSVVPDKTLAANTARSQTPGAASTTVAANAAAAGASASTAPVAAAASTASAASGAAAEVPAAAPAASAPAAAAQEGYKDGTYYGWGTSRHGDIQAEVVIEGGKIASTAIAQCLTRYSCSWIAALVPRVAARQSPPTEYVSGATESSYAFYDAVVEALSQAE